MSASSFSVTAGDGLVVVATPDEIDVGNAGLLRAALREAAAQDQPAIIVDMSATEFCDSTGLNVLVRALRQAAESDRELRLVVGGAALRRILKVTGMASMFRSYDSLDEALDATRRPA